MERQYGADRMVVVAAGDIKHDDFVRQVEDKLGSCRPHAENVTPQYAQYVGGDFREDRDLMDAQIVLGFEGRAYHARDFYASQVLSMILGGGMSSRLFQEVREKRGLCYSVYAFHWGFSDTGLFGVHAATGKDDIAELVPGIGEGDRQRAFRNDIAGTDRGLGRVGEMGDIEAEFGSQRVVEMDQAWARSGGREGGGMDSGSTWCRAAGTGSDAPGAGSGGLIFTSDPAGFSSSGGKSALGRAVFSNPRSPKSKSRLSSRSSEGRSSWD